MREYIRAKWLQDLRSGEYLQGRSQLRREISRREELFCPLGVLCEQARIAGVAWRTREGGYRDFRSGLWPVNEDVDIHGYGRHVSTYVLPWRVMTWAELPSRDPIISISADNNLQVFGSYANDELRHWRVSALNDVAGLSFSQIADLIEADDSLKEAS